MRLFVVLPAVFLVTLSHPPAAFGQAEGSPSEAAESTGGLVQAQTLVEEATAHYADGRYVEAIGAYEQAYAIEPTAALLFNIAFIYDRQLEDPDHAIDYYRRYIRSPDAEPEFVGRAGERVAALSERQAPVIVVAPEPAAPLAPLETPVVVQRSGRDPKWGWGWGVFGSGVALLGGGITLGLLAGADHDDFKGATDLDRKLDLRDSGRAKAISGDVLMGVGAAAIVTGVVLVLVSDRDTAGPTTGWRLTPVAVPSGGVLALGGSL